MKNLYDFAMLGISIGLLATGGPVWAKGCTKADRCIASKKGFGPPQVFKATENDGTAEVIKPSANADVTPAAAVKAPAKPKMVVHMADDTVEIESAPAATNDVADLKRQNEEMGKRLKALEEAKAAEKAEQAEEATDEAKPDEITDSMPAEMLDGSAPQGASAEEQKDVAPAIAKQQTAEAAAPARTSVEARLQEKAKASAEERAALATAASGEAKKKELQERAAAFDVVPDQHISDFAQRLKYTNDILKRYGRAYDYRLTTLKDFKRILAELESAEEKTKKAN